MKRCVSGPPERSEILHGVGAVVPQFSPLWKPSFGDYIKNFVSVIQRKVQFMPHLVFQRKYLHSFYELIWSGPQYFSARKTEFCLYC